MAWNALLPADNSLLINSPAYIRANWDAIALGTDSALLITNAKVATDAAIVDTKLAQISTAGKVSGAALTLLANIPAGAGNIPSANLGNAPDPFKSGDWITSTVTTAHSGWTNVSATYSNKFMRINATPLSTGGADTHSHTLVEANLPSHAHTSGSLAAANEGAHTHTVARGGSGGVPAYLDFGAVNTNGNTNTSAGSAHSHSISGSTGAIGSGTAFTADNVPAYVQVVVFQKD